MTEQKEVLLHLPATAKPVPGRDDSGKAVVINSVGGALSGSPGRVMYGPYTFSYTLQSSVDADGKKYKTKDKRDKKLRPTDFVTQPYWAVHVAGHDLCLSFVEKELTFAKKGK